MSSLDQELLKVRQKIGNSFLRAFYPIDYRSNQNVLKNIDQLLDRETKGLRTLTSTTSQVSQKLERALNSVARDLSEMQDSLEGLIAASNQNDELMKARLDKIENNSSNLNNLLGAMGLLGELLRRRSSEKSKKTAEEKAKKKAEEDAKKKTTEEERAKRTKPTEEGKGGETKAPVEEGAAKGKGRFGGKAVAGANVLLAAYALWQMWTEIQALDPNMKKGAYRQALMQIIGRTVAQVGLAWVGAFVAATVAGALTGGLAAIPGFLVGLAGGALAQYAYGDSVDEIVDQVIDYLYTGDEEEEAGGDAAIQNTEAPAPTPSLQTPEQASTTPGEQVPLAPPLQAPVPPASPLPQAVDGPVEWPIPPAPVEMEFFPGQQKPISSTMSDAAIAEANQRAMQTIPQTPETQGEYMRKLYQAGMTSQQEPNQPGSDTNASIDTNTNQAGGIQPAEGITGSVKVVEAYGRHRPGRPIQAIRDIATRAAEKVGMTQITFTSGVGDWISPARRKAGQQTTRHAGGDALDVTGFSNPSQRVAFMQAARQMGAGGIGAYRDGSVHIDLGSPRVWDLAVGVPGLANGARVNPKSGGTLALIAEAGEPEYVVPQSKAIKFAHEMIAARPQTRTKKHTHVVVVPILT